jgi:hypothetical protein
MHEVYDKAARCIFRRLRQVYGVRDSPHHSVSVSELMKHLGIAKRISFQGKLSGGGTFCLHDRMVPDPNRELQGLFVSRTPAAAPPSPQNCVDHVARDVAIR